MITVMKVKYGIHDPEMLYIGRIWGGHAESIFHNPFHIGKDGNREEVLLKFAEWWYAPKQAWLRARALLEIPADAILGCWCHPQSCHGDIIAGYVNWKLQGEIHDRLFDEF